MGLKVPPTETPGELVARVSQTEPKAAKALQPLATEVTNVTYAGGSIENKQAEEAEQVSAALAAQARSKQSRARWWWLHTNPVNVWRDKIGTWNHLIP